MAYLSATIRRSDQRITDTMPNTVSGVGAPPASTACFNHRAYWCRYRHRPLRVRQAPGRWDAFGRRDGATPRSESWSSGRRSVQEEKADPLRLGGRPHPYPVPVIPGQVPHDLLPQNSRNAITIAMTARAKEMPSTQRTTPGSRPAGLWSRSLSGAADRTCATLTPLQALSFVPRNARS
jgi:hypothetical protein